MNKIIQEKHKLLKQELEKYGAAAVAFSGGVDSTFLAKIAYDVLGEKALAITVDSEAYPPESIFESRKLAQQIGIKLIEIKEQVCTIPEFTSNSPDRCYYCKRELFTRMLEKVHEQGIQILMDGSNEDDKNDYRPGIRALNELNIKSPLKSLGFTKNDIRVLSKELGLPTWNRQSFACLASRFPYGTKITPELLEKTWKSESILKELGFTLYRVRHHGDIARIEIAPEEMHLLMKNDTRKKVVNYIKSLGYKYVTLDIEGFRTGSMNEPLAGK